MKRLLLFGSFCLAMGMASCKTYCPAYSSVQPNTNAETETVTVSTTPSATVATEVNS